MRKKNWNELPAAAKAGIGLLAVVQLTLAVAALRDIRHRPAEELNGSKRLWTVVSCISILGPIAYFLFGRKKS